MLKGFVALRKQAKDLPLRFEVFNNGKPCETIAECGGEFSVPFGNPAFNGLQSVARQKGCYQRKHRQPCRGSKAIARRIVDILVEEQHHAVSTVDKISGQTLGKQFETLTMEFLRETFPYLQNLRPGNWTILQLGNNNKLKTSDFAQYEHLAYLNALTTQNAQLAAALGNDYLVAPDVVVYRDLYEDSEINAAQPIVDDEICKMADIRKSNGGKPILHASVSAKYTMRSDRAQNSRTEALNLIRNRKGHLPHIVVVTAEPMPNRLASLALGTGDIDCVYHFALYELIRAVKEAGSEDAVETLETLVQGKRLKDISDLPLDLSV